MTDITRLIEKMIAEEITVSTMESCTSGLIASTITDTEGASAIFPGSFVTYCNQAKIDAGVPVRIIETNGVYSPECARAMAETVQKHFQTQVAIGITGTTGNVDPNNGDSVQGIAYYCILVGDQAYDCEISVDVSGLSRKDIKKIYTEMVFETLSGLL